MERSRTAHLAGRSSAPRVPPVLTRWRSAIDARLRASAPPLQTLLGRMAAYHMGWTDADGRPLDGESPGNGKLFRGHLVMWASDATGGSPERALPVAAATEWIHSFTLVHDDVQDGDLMRRGRAAVRAVWGDGQAINAGDTLHAIAFRELLADGPEPERRLAAARALLDGLLEVIEGQSRDLQMEGRAEAPLAGYLEVIGAKTGALLGASLEAGARISGAPEATGERLRQAGQLLGLAFQLRDDWLGMWGDPDVTGKSRESDLDRRKVTYPVVIAHERATEEQRAELERLFATPDPAATPRLRAIVESVAGARLAAGAAVDLAEKATGVVADAGLAPSSVREFADVADYAARRER